MTDHYIHVYADFVICLKTISITQGYTALNDRMIVNNCKGHGTKWVWHNYYPCISMKKCTKIFRTVSSLAKT